MLDHQNSFNAPPHRLHTFHPKDIHLFGVLMIPKSSIHEGVKLIWWLWRPQHNFQSQIIPLTPCAEHLYPLCFCTHLFLQIVWYPMLCSVWSHIDFMFWSPCLCVCQELAAIKARVQELEMEEETERMREEEERCDAIDMQLLTSSPRPGETARASSPPSWFVTVVTLVYS